MFPPVADATAELSEAPIALSDHRPSPPLPVPPVLPSLVPPPPLLVPEGMADCRSSWSLSHAGTSCVIELRSERDKRGRNMVSERRRVFMCVVVGSGPQCGLVGTDHHQLGLCGTTPCGVSASAATSHGREQRQQQHQPVAVHTCITISWACNRLATCCQYMYAAHLHLWSAIAPYRLRRVAERTVPQQASWATLYAAALSAESRSFDKRLSIRF